LKKAAVDMELERKLIAAIMGAISAYIPMEQQPFSQLMRLSPNQRLVV